jgi:hypothetical protein
VIYAGNDDCHAAKAGILESEAGVLIDRPTLRWVRGANPLSNNAEAMNAEILDPIGLVASTRDGGFSTHPTADWCYFMKQEKATFGYSVLPKLLKLCEFQLIIGYCPKEGG